MNSLTMNSLTPEEFNTLRNRSLHNERMKRYYIAHPEQRWKLIQKIKNKYNTDEAYREKVKERSRLYRLRQKELKKASLVLQTIA